jgi:beta-mannosidase
MRAIKQLTEHWSLTWAGAAKPIPFAIPGDTHSAMLAAGLIKDPFYATNELDVQDLNLRDWTLTTTFTLTADDLADGDAPAKAFVLDCPQIDTVADLTLNGTAIGHTDNMFCRSRFTVPAHLLKVGPNTLTLLLHSAEKIAAERKSKLPYPIPHVTFPIQSPDRNLVRKVQCHAGWDWGCCLMVAGVYEPITLCACDRGRIEYVHVDQHHTAGSCELTIHCDYLAETSFSTTLSATLGDIDVVQPVTLTAGENHLSLTLTVPNPKLWWPAGYGDQPLYTLTVAIDDETVTQQLGLRKLELISEPDDIGRSFYFRVNDVDIFAKGANWIPAHALPQHQTDAMIEDLIRSAVDANMNMLRVWGGGQYERDSFYALCDRYGILIWHDFMFSCSLYPGDDAFVASVEAEARHQVRRLKSHACIALWCGDNENLGALRWCSGDGKHKDDYRNNYLRLNGVIRNAVKTLDPTRSFWISSPCAAPDDYDTDCFHADAAGDMHYWNVWHESAPFEDYLKVQPRFCSEFGFQSFPCTNTIRSFLPTDQYDPLSQAMVHHQRNPGGNERILKTMGMYFDIPTDFARTIYLSQVQQACAIQTAVEFWRTCRPRTMGTIFWQLNDNWPVCSWSSIDHGGQWKLLQYQAKRFFAPVLATLVRHGHDLDLRIVNDHTFAVDAELTIDAWTFTGQHVQTKTIHTKLAAGSAQSVLRCTRDAFFAAAHDGLLHLTLTANGTTSYNTFALTEWKNCTLAQPTITVHAASDAQGLTVTLTADKPAVFVALETLGIAGTFDDNNITLLPNQPRTLRFVPKDAAATIDVKTFEKSLSLYHLAL